MPNSQHFSSTSTVFPRTPRETGRSGPRWWVYGLVCWVLGVICGLAWLSLATSAPAPHLQAGDPDARFTPSATSVCPTWPITFANQSVGTTPITFCWTFGDGGESGAISPVYSYTLAGTYTMILTATNALGSDVATATIAVQPSPTALFTHTPALIYTNTVVQFQDQSTGDPTGWMWNLGNGTIITGTPAPTHTYVTTGTFQVALTATNSCGSDVYTAPVSVIAGPPAPDFVPRSAVIGLGVPITWTNLTAGTPPLTYTWEFGDGVTSTVPSPSHTYAITGTFGVTLTATNAFGTGVATGTVQVSHYGLHLPLVLRDHRPPTQVEYGANLADLGNADLMNDIGFTWVKGFLEWGRAEPSKGNYHWGDVDNVLAVCQARGLKLILRVDRPPAWANGSGGTAPPHNAADYGDFMGALAAHCQGQLTGIAYEVWNEPNLEIEWGGQAPDPARYTNLLKAAYPRVKAADPDAWVVTAGLATTGGTLTEAQPDGRLTATVKGLAWNDLHYIQDMYNAGAKGYFDALGSHPYGFAFAPEHDPTDPAVNGLCFRRAEQQHEIMIANGDGDTPIWATEFGWLLDPAIDGLNCHGWGSWPSREWQIVSPQTQATYLVNAYGYAKQYWPWMGVMAIFNLDFGADFYQGWALCNEMRYYSLVYRTSPRDPGNSPRQFRPAYHTLKAMPK